MLREEKEEVQFCFGKDCYYYERYPNKEVQMNSELFGMKCGNKEVITYVISTIPTTGLSCSKWVERMEANILNRDW